MTSTKTGMDGPKPEYPDQDQIAAYGAISFLYMRAPKYDRISFSDIRLLIQPPVDLRFYHIRNIEGVPRAAITWAFLSPEAEAKLINGQMIAPRDWASGTQAWIMELIAPYPGSNLGARLTKSFLKTLGPDHLTARFPRFASPGVLKHVTEFRRDGPDKWTSHRIPAREFDTIS
ncbi:toxin-activating lysine-acyltransferase [Antarctobacter sp.]|uniref:toxin-activating lysine-acyltransferase n=1 Tax=Antarctobacter sp. TaxID=1872577 RepID=UPI002B26A6F7|nr:toxin-activating lysine-acyltransferase [Antarctobacter sp.]